MNPATILVFILGLMVGAVVIAWVLGKRHRVHEALLVRDASNQMKNSVQIELVQSAERLAAKINEADQLRLDLKEARDTLEATRVGLAAAREDVARLATELNESREKIQSQATFFESARETLNIQFKTLASEILEEKGKRLSESHRGELGLILGPLSEKLAAFQSKVEEVYVTEGQQRFSLAQEVQKLQAASAKLGEDASNLTRALKGEAKTRGNWGEVMLETILERSGLAKGREYDVQMHLASAEGKQYPDVVVHLPEGKHIVIDSKVSLVAYDRYYSAESDLARELALTEHVASLKRHYVDLGKKNYHGNSALNSPDFVVMFVPIEPAFNLAAAKDAALIFDAFDLKVVIVTPGTLLAMLSTVATLWKREQQSRNALEIARKAGEMYDKFVGVVEAFEDVGKRLSAAQKSYDDARSRLSMGRGNVIKGLEDLKKLGVKPGKTLPADLLAKAGLEPGPELAADVPAALEDDRPDDAANAA